jgi:hypothetical protein
MNTVQTHDIHFMHGVPHQNWTANAADGLSDQYHIWQERDKGTVILGLKIRVRVHVHLSERRILFDIQTQPWPPRLQARKPALLGACTVSRSSH